MKKDKYVEFEVNKLTKKTLFIKNIYIHSNTPAYNTLLLYKTTCTHLTL